MSARKMQPKHKAVKFFNKTATKTKKLNNFALFKRGGIKL